jgi:acetyl esterase/lipase
MKKILFAFLLAGNFSITGFAQTNETNSARTDLNGVRVEKGVVFLDGSRREKADLYFPATMPAGKTIPALVWIHGGGWSTGLRDAKREVSVCSTLASNGYVMMSIDYLLSDKRQAVWPTNLWDCKNAVRWLRKNAGRLGVDPERIGVAGGSAGGHLAAMVALTMPMDGLNPAEPLGDVSCAVKCCVDLYGIADIGTYHDATMLGKTFAVAPELYHAASPVTYVRSNSVPVLICHGTADKTVNLQQSKLFDQVLTRSGVAHHFEIVTNAAHTFDLHPPQEDLRPLVLEFLRTYLQ